MASLYQMGWWKTVRKWRVAVVFSVGFGSRVNHFSWSSDKRIVWDFNNQKVRKIQVIIIPDDWSRKWVRPSLELKQKTIKTKYFIASEIWVVEEEILTDNEMIMLVYLYLLFFSVNSLLKLGSSNNNIIKMNKIVNC